MIDQRHLNQTGQACPKCHQMDRIQKVSAIATAGISNTTLTGLTGTSGYIHDSQHSQRSQRTVTTVGYTALTGGSQTLQSQILSPPPAPTYHSPWGIWSILGVLFFAFLTLIGLVISSISMTIFALLLGTLIVVLKVKKSSKEYARVNAQYLRWKEAMSRWDRLYYCERDDGVFIPGPNSMFVPSRQMMQLI